MTDKEFTDYIDQQPLGVLYAVAAALKVLAWYATVKPLAAEITNKIGVVHTRIHYLRLPKGGARKKGGR